MTYIMKIFAGTPENPIVIDTDVDTLKKLSDQHAGCSGIPIECVLIEAASQGKMKVGSQVQKEDHETVQRKSNGSKVLGHKNELRPLREKFFRQG
jgi:hypothetical protein